MKNLFKGILSIIVCICLLCVLPVESQAESMISSQSHNPVGELCSAVAVGDTISVVGWAYDPDCPQQSVTAVISLDDVVTAVIPAAENLPAYAGEFPSEAGPSHCFTVWLHAPGGTHQLRIVLLNREDGQNTAIETDVSVSNSQPNTLVLPESLTTIDAEAFLNCDAQEIVIPASVTRIGDKAFQGCSHLTKLIFESSQCELGSDILAGSNAAVVCRNGSAIERWASEQHRSIACQGKSEHTLVTETTQEPTCTTGGKTTTACTLCGEILGTETSEKTGKHRPVKEPVVESTCYILGYGYYKCTDCGEYLNMYNDTDYKTHQRVDSVDGEWAITSCSLCGTVFSKTYNKTQEQACAEMLAMVNDLRAQNGLEPLVGNAFYSYVARVRAEELVTYWGHGSASGINRHLGENICTGYPSVAEQFNCWYRSEGHRENMLDEYYELFGYGYYVHNDGKPDASIFAVQIFGWNGLRTGETIPADTDFNHG